MGNNIFYYPHQLETDRPMLAYLKGDKFSLAVDAGNSAAHVDEFYGALKARGLSPPDFTVITHWHWDHSFGMHHSAGVSIAHRKTNDFLRRERDKLSNSTYIDFLKEDDPCLGREYAGGKEITVVPSDLEFSDELILDLGGLTAVIYHTVSPHSEDTTLIYVPEEKKLFLGDATSEDFFNHGYMDKHKLQMLIREIEKTDCRYCILSHAEPLAKLDLLDYLYTL
ncbi:MBL fold metallo-hydrolase [Treponema sp. OttesenSCG-928-L16]|nr:MBL fold metallo-hydrolase [Treponema sp. OttesenSCG-928-L16]